MISDIEFCEMTYISRARLVVSNQSWQPDSLKNVVAANISLFAQLQHQGIKNCRLHWYVDIYTSRMKLNQKTLYYWVSLAVSACLTGRPLVQK